MPAKNIIDIIICAVTAIIGFIGLTLSSSAIKKGIRKEVFLYYTNLSNIAVVLFQLCLLVSYSMRQSAFHTFLAAPWFRLTAAMMILLTFIVYHFLLRPEIKKNAAEPMARDKSIGNICVHYAVPIITFIQWIISADKDGLLVTDGLIWLICPAVYAAFIIIRAKIIDLRLKQDNDSFSEENYIKYPYGFLNVDVLGGARVAANIAIVGIACAAIGCLSAVTAIFLSA